MKIINSLFTRVVNFLIYTLFATLRLLFVVLVRLLPWISRIFIWSFWLTLMFFVAWWQGLPVCIERATYLWMERLHSGGVTANFDPFLQPTLRVIAFFAYLSGWVIYAHATVFLLWLIFR